jgi:hypothetical protein
VLATAAQKEQKLRADARKENEISPCTTALQSFDILRHIRPARAALCARARPEHERGCFNVIARRRRRGPRAIDFRLA